MRSPTRVIIRLTPRDATVVVSAMSQPPTKAASSVEMAVRFNLSQLEGEARALGAMSLPPDRQRELFRIEERIRDLREQLAALAGP